MTETAPERFQRVLNENNLYAQLIEPKVRALKDGAMLIEQPLISISFSNPALEIVPIDPSLPATAEEGMKNDPESIEQEGEANAGESSEETVN